MNRKLVLISSVCLGLLLGVVTPAILAGKGGSKVTARFVNSEPSNGVFPSYDPSVRLDFAVDNVGSKPASVVVTEIQDQHGTWVPVSLGGQRQKYTVIPLPSPRITASEQRADASNGESVCVSKKSICP
jgi:hypothetical protein